MNSVRHFVHVAAVIIGAFRFLFQFDVRNLFVRPPLFSRKPTRAMQRISAQPDLGALFKATFSGPETVPDDVFTDDFYRRIFST